MEDEDEVKMQINSCENSSDDELAEQLIKAGLMRATHKRRATHTLLDEKPSAKKTCKRQYVRQNALLCAPLPTSNITAAPAANSQLYRTPDEAAEASILPVCAPLPTPNITETPAISNQLYQSPDEGAEAPVTLVCAPPSTPNIKEGLAADIEPNQGIPNAWIGTKIDSNIDLTLVNIDNLPFIEKIGDQYIGIDSGIQILPISSLSQDSNANMIFSPLTATQDLADILLSIEVQSKPQEARVIEIPANLSPNNLLKSPMPYEHKLPNAGPDELLVPALSVPAPSFIDLAAADNQPNQIQDNLPETPEPSHSQSNPIPNESPGLFVSSSPPSPSLLQVPAHSQLLSQPNEAQSSNNRVVIISDVPYHGDMGQNKKRNNKTTKDSKLWKRNLNKEKRSKGENYLGYRRDKQVGTKFKVVHDVFKSARCMKPPCISSFCLKSKLRSCDTISQESRQHLFTKFWKEMSWEQRRAYICSHVVKNPKKVTKNPDSKRSESRAYFFTINHVRYQVRKKIFMATLGIKDWFIRYWMEKTNCAMPPNTETSQKEKKGPEKVESKEYATLFLKRLPKMPSHYCRASTSKLYLEPIFTTMVDVYNVYNNACEVDSKQCLSLKVFKNIFDKNNIGLFHPKKDQCDLCCSFKVGNLSKEDYDGHIAKKDRARAEKTTDKLFAQAKKCHVFTQDVESVKLAPILQASAIYFKTKLCVHNFTIYNLANQEVMCYWFDESNSTLEASVFASCVVEHISKTLEICALPVILYSDGCCAQNRNAILSNALLRVAIEKKVLITQKYLEKGHTQMECDSVHSAIECKVKGKEIYLPDQYVAISKSARLHPMPYEAKLLDFSFFTDFSKDLIYKSIRPGMKTGDPYVTDIRVLEYYPDGIIKYKTTFDEDSKPLPLRPTPLYRIKPIDQLPKLFTGRLPISSRTFQDWQDLKSVIPENCHAFYDQLPHT